MRSVSSVRNLYTKLLSVNSENVKKPLNERNSNKDKKNSPPNKPKDDFSPAGFCMENVKKYDYENYLTSMLIMGPAIRRCVFAVRAFNAELAQIRDLTSNQTIAQMRFQFWSDLIDEIYAGKSKILPGNQPVAYEIQHCHNNCKGKLSKHWFKKLIETRGDAVNLSNNPFQSMHDLENYSEATVSPIYYLAIESSLALTTNEKVDSRERLKYDHIASHLGKAQGITNVMRGILHNAKYGRCYVPNDVLLNHKVSHEDFLRRNDSQNVRNASFEMANIANQHVEIANSLAKNIPKDKKLLFLPLFTVNKYLVRIQKSDFNIFDPKLNIRQGTLPLSLWCKSNLIKLGF